MRQSKPSWLKIPISGGRRFFEVDNILGGLNLYSVCREARCPNRMECYGKGTATFLLLGPDCTRHCAFCGVESKTPYGQDTDEPRRTALAVKKLRLRYVVLTSVTRDDLPDGGAFHFAETIREIRLQSPQTKIEILVPDFMGRQDSIEAVVKAAPDVFNHNIETVSRLYPLIRPEADYRRSLGLLTSVKKVDPAIPVKSGFMVGLGEETGEISGLLHDLKECGCEIVTVGQYLQPSADNEPVHRYYTPDEFMEIRGKALSLGFRSVAAGPLVRSSYKAGEIFSNLS